MHSARNISTRKIFVTQHEEIGLRPSYVHTKFGYTLMNLNFDTYIHNFSLRISIVTETYATSSVNNYVKSTELV